MKGYNFILQFMKGIENSKENLRQYNKIEDKE